MTFPESDYVTVHTSTEPYIISQLEDLMEDHQVDYRVKGSMNAAAIDQGAVAVPIHLQVIKGEVERARELITEFFTPIDPSSPDLPEELRPDAEGDDAEA